MPNDVAPSKRAEELATAFLSRVWNGAANEGPIAVQKI